jgi:hypothetical protein
MLLADPWSGLEGGNHGDRHVVTVPAPLAARARQAAFLRIVVVRGVLRRRAPAARREGRLQGDVAIGPGAEDGRPCQRARAEQEEQTKGDGAVTCVVHVWKR